MQFAELVSSVHGSASRNIKLTPSVKAKVHIESKLDSLLAVCVLRYFHDFLTKDSFLVLQKEIRFIFNHVFMCMSVWVPQRS